MNPALKCAMFLLTLRCATISWALDDVAGIHVRERLKSCDPIVSLAAAEEIVRDPSLLKEPLEMFSPAMAIFMRGKKDEGVFWFYAAQLRTRYRLVFEKGDRGQLMTIMMMTMGAPINIW